MALMRKLWQNPASAAGLAIILTVLIASVIGKWITPFDPMKQQLAISFQGPSAAHWLGTDDFGRDLLSRLMYGASTSLVVGIASVMLGMLLGVPAGILAAYYRGWVEVVIMRVVDILLSFPMLLMAIALISVFDSGLTSIILAIGVSMAPQFARVARGSALGVVGLDYVLAARLVGRSNLATMVVHILPNVLTPVVVVATLNIGLAIIIEASLSFLGLGIPPTVPTWGGIASAGTKFLREAPWISGFTSVAIMLVVLAFNLVGDRVRDLVDPRLSEH